jgi:eukaryotic-like serine/threonine-protein kinase
MWNKIKSKPFLFTLIKSLFVAVLIVTITLLWLRFYTNHSEKIETPSFIGLSIEEANKLAADNNLRLEIDSVFSSKPLNTIILQNPVSHSDSTQSWVKSNRIVYLTLVRSSKQQIKLPNIKDNSKSLASTKLSIAGLNPSWEYQASPFKDVVLDVKYKSKSVKEGFLLEKGSQIKVIIGKGQAQALQVQVPNLIGKTISEANIELANKSFQLIPIFSKCEGCKTASDSASAIIELQNPEYVEGYTVAEGSEIIVTLSK